MSMNGARRDVRAMAAEIKKALKGLDQVSFRLTTVIHYDDHPKCDIVSTEVTLWIGHEFSVRVSGSDDAKWLAQACRRKAIESLAKLKEISKSIS
jgi:hypothetical protein